MKKSINAKTMEQKMSSVESESNAVHKKIRKLIFWKWALRVLILVLFALAFYAINVDDVSLFWVLTPGVLFCWFALSAISFVDNNTGEAKEDEEN